MKRIYLLLVLIVMSAASAVTAQTKVYIGDLYYYLEGDEASVARPNGYDYAEQTYTVPPQVEYNGLIFNVTSIADRAFYNSKLRSITLPNTLRRIGEFAFSECYNLTSVIIPSSVFLIEESAFEGCGNLTSVIFQSPTSVTLIGVGVRAFQDCVSLSTMVIPASVGFMQILSGDAYWAGTD